MVDNEVFDSVKYNDRISIYHIASNKSIGTRNNLVPKVLTANKIVYSLIKEETLTIIYETTAQYMQMIRWFKPHSTENSKT